MEPLSDGRVIAAWGVWDDSHFAVAVVTLDEAGSLVDLRLLSEPSTHQDARLSTVRWLGPDTVVGAYSDDDSYSLRYFKVVN